MAPPLKRDEASHRSFFKEAPPARRRRLKKFGPNRSANYLTWIRKRPCCVCGAPGPSEASHHGRRGMGQKASDLSCAPLCRTHHHEWHTYGHFTPVGYNTKVLAELHVLRTLLALHDEWFRMERAA
jgi:hypothetical protein